MAVSRGLWSVALAAMVGCTPLVASYRADAGDSTPTDIGSDIGMDVGMDVGMDSGVDVGADGGADVGADVLGDVGEDVAAFRCATSGDCADSGSGAVCDTTTGRCVECVASADTCPAGRYCVAATQQCALGCRDDDGCAAAAGDGGVVVGRRCEVTTHACVACVVDSHCPPGNLCMGNACVTGCSATQACANGQTCCAGGCVDTASNVANCGACGTACAVANATAACAGGACRVAGCTAPFADCDGVATNGCEADTATSGAHCGACGMACAPAHATGACAAGRCGVGACAAGYADCDGDAANGCETDVNTTATACGGCGMACTVANGVAACVAGRCGVGSCVAGFADCDGMAANGCETSTATSPSNCGSCNSVCSLPNATAGCASGACTIASCTAGFANCDGNAANGCEVNLNSDSANCGACSTAGAPRACTVGQLCSAGVCVTSCGSGQTDCSNVCRNLTSDPDSCGTCGTVCSGAGIVVRTCGGSVCNGTCSAGRANCDSNLQSNGCETDINSSVATCGGCTGMACSSNNIAAACSGGNCTGTCSVGFADCDGDKRTNGCEINTTSNASHCGGCGTVCPTRANAAATPCVSSACTIGTCNAGFGNCDGMAVNGCEAILQNDRSNCGACGRECPSGYACTAGVCEFLPGLTQRSCAVSGTPGCGLVAITGGSFTMGEASVAYDASPVQSGVVVGNFVLDAYEVTVARFNAFWSARAAALSTIRRAPIAYPGGQSIGWDVAAQEPIPQDSSYNWSLSSSSRDAHPMNGVDYWLSQEFCVWDGGRLPTEAEWEYAGRGRVVNGLSTGRAYPWGDTDASVSCDRALWNSCSGSDGGVTRRVGNFAATGGLYDLAGSVSEWTADNRGTYPSCWMSATNPLCTNSATGFRVLRGGSRASNVVVSLRSASRDHYPPTVRSSTIGFRCARAASTPRPISPTSTATVTSQRPTLRWQLAPGTNGARVEICRDRACATIEQTLDVTGSSAVPGTNLAPGVHFWRLLGRVGTTVGSVASPAWEFFVGHRSATLDTSWGTVADFNGDGLGDAAIGAQGADGNRGKAYVYNGRRDMLLSSVPNVTIAGPDAGGFFGHSIASAGDLNGDGFTDMVVGAYGVSANAGRVYIYFGQSTGLAAVPDITLRDVTGAEGYFGVAVDGAGDVNADGYGDLVVGSQGFATGTGRAYVYLGGPGGPGSTPDITLAGTGVGGDLFGYSVAGAGDLDGDGFADLAVGAPGGASAPGSVLVFRGGTAFSAIPALILTNPGRAVANFGVSVASAGDLNGDGLADVIVGAYMAAGGAGAAHVYAGRAGAMNTTPAVTIPSPVGGGFGSSVSGGGDLDGDGFYDVLVGAPRANSGSGAAYAFRGGVTMVGVTPSLVLGPAAGGEFGSALTGMGDSDGDGFDDIIVGAPLTSSRSGVVNCYRGSAAPIATTPVITIVSPDGVGGLFGVSVGSP